MHTKTTGQECMDDSALHTLLGVYGVLSNPYTRRAYLVLKQVSKQQFYSITMSMSDSREMNCSLGENIYGKA